MGRAKVLSTGTKGFGSPNPSWKPGDCDSKPHPPGMEGLGMPQQDFGISWGHCPICWEYPGNPFFPIAFLSPKEAGCPTNPKTGYSCPACSEEKDASFLQIVKVYHLFGFGPDWAGFGLIQSDCFSGEVASQIALDSTMYQFHCNHARFLKRQVTLHISRMNTPVVQDMCKGDATTWQPSAGCFCEQKNIWLLGL